MKTILSIILLFCASLGLAHGKDADAKFKLANSFYAKGQYEKASKIYESLITEHYNTPELHYNLANSYYRMDLLSKSILHYEKAKKLSQSNDDINFNLQLANTKTVDKINQTPELFIIKWGKSISKLYGSGGWAGISIIFLWLSAILFICFLILKKPFQKRLLFLCTGLTATLFIFSIIFASVSYSAERSSNEGIIMPSNVYVKSSPDNASQDLFILHEGTKVTILDKVGNWYEIKLSDGNKGWASKSALAII